MDAPQRNDMSGRKFSTSAIVALFASILLCGVILAIIVTGRSQTDKLLMEQLIMEKTEKLTAVIHRMLYKTEALSALVIQNDGEINNFDRVAATLIDDPAISNVLIAPGGVVTHVYPEKDNQAVLGLDFFKEGAGNKEAILAKEKGQLVFGGPFPLVQGGQALVGRLPVYLPGKGAFWGLVSVTLKYPEILDSLGLPLLEKQGYAFEIWRVSPDTGERQVIAHSNYEYDKTARFIEKSMEILNAVWHFRLAPVKMWYYYAEIWVLILLSVSASCLVAFVVQNNHELKLMQARLEKMARSDSLIGIANRRHFMETAPALLNHAARRNQSCFIMMLDLDHFKKVNDTYGHLAGDLALTIFAGRVKSIIRPYDLFARYGGEEFVILAVDLGDREADALATRIRLALCDTPFRLLDGTTIAVSASFGLAQVAPGDSLDDAIRRADEALYKAKREGRNRIVCHSVEK